jgi:hypothetical protein
VTCAAAMLVYRAVFGRDETRAAAPAAAA